MIKTKITFAGWVLRFLAIVMLLSTMAGCQTMLAPYMRYERPKLFDPCLPLPSSRNAKECNKLKADRELQSKLQGADKDFGIYPDISQMHVTSGKFELQIYDKCEGQDTTFIATYPAELLIKKDPPTGGKTTGTATIDLSAKSTAPDNSNAIPRLVVRSCKAAGRDAKAAHELGQLIDIPIAQGYGPLTTRANMWPREDAAEEFGEEFSRNFIVTDVVFENPNPKPVLLYGSSLSMKARFLYAEDSARAICKGSNNPQTVGKEDVSNVCGPDRRKDIDLDQVEFFRPLSFPDLVALFTFKRQSDPRQQLVDLLKSVGELAAGAGIFITARDYAKGVSFFTGIVNPQAEKLLLWDVLLHVKNLDDRALKEVEQVQPHGQLRRIVFFPARGIRGITALGDMYLAEIARDEVPVSAVYLEDARPVGQAAPNARPSAPSPGQNGSDSGSPQ
jgi:hypothetical protein